MKDFVDLAVAGVACAAGSFVGIIAANLFFMLLMRSKGDNHDKN